jgi:N-acetylgalactosamine-N,N'-diacetylbacillosaminyl-diphospho-undecaprenol 4-alpha-N-acetylgalactosaminyltransferase
MSWIDRLALKTIYHFKNVQGVIVPAEGLKKSLEKNTGLTNIVTIPNAVDLDSIQKMIVVPLQKNSRKSIVAVGRMVAIKRFDYLIRTFAKSTMCHDVDLVLVGGGEELDSLKKLAVDLGLANVKFIGQSDNPYHYMADARCLVVTSEMETFANVIIESFACGTPVVSVDCDFGPREIIRDSIDGYLVPLDDDQLLMQRIQEIVMNDETYQSMRINALERAQDFSVPMTIKRWEDFFEKIEDDKVIKI